MDKKKVGILTLPITTNYGGILQLFALYQTLQKKGYDVKYIRRRWNSVDYGNIHKFKRWIYQTFIIRKFKKFEYKYLSNSTRKIESHEEFVKLCEDFYAIVVGSDQVWRAKNTRGVGDDYFLDIGDKKTKRIAYAASFGIDYWDEISPNHTRRVRSLLNNFSKLTVRETSGVKICHDIFGVKAYQVLDPTLLLEKDDYIRTFGLKRNKFTSTKVLGVYLLDESIEKQKLIDEFASKYGFVVNYVNRTSLSRLDKILPKDLTKSGIEDWLTAIYNSDFMLTDSFHGTVFSIIFNKPFYSINNVNRGSTRFESLFDYLGIQNRLITNNILPSIDPFIIDFDTINRRIEELRIDSLMALDC